MTSNQTLGSMNGFVQHHPGESGHGRHGVFGAFEFDS